MAGCHCADDGVGVHWAQISQHTFRSTVAQRPRHNDQRQCASVEGGGAQSAVAWRMRSEGCAVRGHVGIT